MNYSLTVINSCKVADDNLLAHHTVCKIINNVFSPYSMYDPNQYVNLLRRDDVQVLESKHELIYKWPTGPLDIALSFQLFRYS